MVESWDVVWLGVDSECQSAPRQQGRQDAADTEDSSCNHVDMTEKHSNNNVSKYS